MAAEMGEERDKKGRRLTHVKRKNSAETHQNAPNLDQNLAKPSQKRNRSITRIYSEQDHPEPSATFSPLRSCWP